MKEELTKAVDDISFLCDDLKEVLTKSNNIQGMIVLDLIRRANELRIDISRFKEWWEKDSLM